MGAGPRCAVPPCALGGERKKPQSFCAEACALSRRSAFVNNERPEVLLCESSASETRARRAGDRSRWRNFPACGALNWLACGAFRSACGARREPGQSARPAAPLCYSRLIRVRSRGELACVQKRIRSRSACCCAGDRLAGRLPFVFCFLLVVARQAVCHSV